MHVPAWRRPLVGIGLVAVLLAACSADPPAPSGPIVAGTSAKPREIVVIARDYLFEPSAIRVVPGETVLIHLIDAGLLPHELVLGDATVQSAWEAAEASASPAPPGHSPAIDAPTGSAAGLRVVVASGERRDVTWTVPASGQLIAGCHIPGHYAKGMQVPVVLATTASG